MNLPGKDESYYGYLAGLVSIIGNILLFGIKYWAGIVSGSVAIMADAWHTLTDSVSSIALMVGIKISKKPADKEHPFGHGRVEFLTSLFIAIFLGVIAYNFVNESIKKLLSRDAAEYGTIAIVATIISLIAKEIMARFSFKCADKSGRKSIKADGWHHRTDALSSLIILAGIIFSGWFWWIDGVLGLMVSAMILYAAYDIMKDSISSLIGEAPDKLMINDIQKIANDTAEMDLQAHKIHLHDYGFHKELIFHIKLPVGTHIETAYEIIKDIEHNISRKYEMRTTVRIEPDMKSEKI